MHFGQEAHRLSLLGRPYSFFAIRSFSAALSSAISAYIRLSLAFSASSSLTRFRSDASRLRGGGQFVNRELGVLNFMD